MQLVISGQEINKQTISVDTAQDTLSINSDPVYQVTIIRDVSLKPEYIHLLEQVNTETGERLELLSYLPPNPPPPQTHKYIVDMYVSMTSLPNITFKQRRYNLTEFIKQYNLCLMDTDYFFVTSTP